MDSRPTGQAAEDAKRALADARWAEKAGLPDRAIAAYRHAAALCPTDADVHHRLAGLLLSLGQAEEALQAATRAQALSPQDALINASVGRACRLLGRGTEAVPHLRAALAACPERHALRRELADTLLELGRKDEAVATFSPIEAQVANDVEVLAMMAEVYRRADAGERAERCYRRLLALAPERDATYDHLAQLYLDHARYSEAREVAEQGLRRNPGQPRLLNTLGLAQASLGRVPDALASYRKVIAMAPQMATSHSNLLLTMHYSSDVGPADIAAEHRRWGQLHAPPGLATRAFPNAPVPARRLRLGYVSPDFRRHSVAFFFEALLDHRSRADFEVFCYSDVRAPDEVTRRIRAKADQFRNIVDLHDSQVAAQIRADGIDILVDLAGHAGSSRVTLLGHKPAPVQLTYCGYPDTTGIEAVDYRLTDWLADPAGVEPFYTETLCRLPGAFLCFRPPDSLPEITPPPSASGKPVTFGSFNREFKLSQDTWDLWSRILLALPESRIVIKSIASGDPGTRALQLRELTRRGVAAERIDLVGFIADPAGHLAGYRNVDIALDTYPYHGTTTTLDALLMSVPVITLAGYNHASRVGVSLLTRVGLQEFIAATPDDYVALATGLARQPQRIAALHAGLRERLLRSPLCDGPAFVRGYEYALRGMWCRWCRAQGATLGAAAQAMAAFDFSPLAADPAAFM